MAGETLMTARRRLGHALAFAWAAGPRKPLPWRAVGTDIALAVLFLAVSLIPPSLSYSGADHSILGFMPWQPFLAAAVISVPLAARRRFPLAAYAALLAGGTVTRGYQTDLALVAVVIAAYSAIAHSRFRGAALLSVPLAWVAVQAVILPTPPPMLGDPAPAAWDPMPVTGGLQLAANAVLASMVMIASIGYAVHAGDARARLRAENEAATQRALDLERARIASELHDVVTHNVSVMIVQAGAARHVLDGSPSEAREALLAVEASGRAAMTELRHLLGLLSPSNTAGEDAGTSTGATPAGQHLEPQPSMAQLQPLIDRLAAAGLPVELHAGELPAGLPAGQELAAFRVIQEALTNVIKHAGKPRTSVSLGYRQGGLVVEVTDAGRPLPAAAPGVPPGCGRGLLGLRERLALYGGELAAGPRPGGGWRVHARIPVEPPPRGGHGPAPAAASLAPTGAAHR
jgi:signal transduction histidine kinase